MREIDTQFIVLSGQGDVQRAVFAFAAALAAVAGGARVSVVLSMHGALWAAPHTGLEASVPEFKPLAELMREFIALGGHVEACASCVENYCPSEVGPDGRKVLREGIERIGLGAVAMRMADVHTVVV
jgi:predicted peroxiredoxin